MKDYLIRGLALWLICVSVPVLADLPKWLTPPMQARKVQNLKDSVPDYQLALSSVIKINGLLRLENEQHLLGELTRSTWQLPADFQPSAVMQRVHEQLARHGAVFLFECEGRACGASNIWANDLFATSQLYGIDETQIYSAARIGSRYFAVYVVRRGNQRVYLNVDQLQVSATPEGGWQQTLKQQGWVALPGWPDEPEKATDELESLLRDQTALKIRLVVYQAGDDIEASLSQSKGLAETMKQRLVDDGIDSSRVSAFGVGALVPQVLGSRQQLMVVVVDKN